METTPVVLCLGSNVPEADSLIASALDNVKRLGPAVHSATYVTPSHTGIGADYTNCVAMLRSTLTLEQLQETLSEMEIRLGRLPDSRRTGVMPMDIDIVVYNGLILRPEDYERRHFRIGYAELLNHCPVQHL